MRKLTQEEKEEIVSGIESEGFEYYFLDYTNKWESLPTELQPLVKNFTDAARTLLDEVESWGIEFE